MTLVTGVVELVDEGGASQLGRLGAAEAALDAVQALGRQVRVGVGGVVPTAERPIEFVQRRGAEAFVGGEAEVEAAAEVAPDARLGRWARRPTRAGSSCRRWPRRWR